MTTKQIIVEGLTGREYGVRGESTGNTAYKNGYGRRRAHDICVGDVVSYNDSVGNAFSGVVLKNGGRYGIMGRGINHLDYANLTITVPYERVPIEMINALHKVNFEYKEVETVETVEMTLEEIEELVGKHVKIIKEGR